MRISKIIITILLSALTTAVSAQTKQLTICDGTDYNAYVPFCGFGNMDDNQTSQMLYPADLLAELSCAKISAMIFYPREDIDWNTTNTWSMATVEQGDLASKTFLDAPFAEVAKTVGTYDKTEKTWTITLDAPFVYTGGNLLLQGFMPKDYNGNKTFYGKNQSVVTALTNYNNMGMGFETEASKFLPKVTFVYEEATPDLELGEIVFSEGFESYTDAFTTAPVGEWTYIDGDLASTYAQPGLTAIPHAGEAMAYQLMDTSDSRFQATYKAHGGSRFLMAMGARDGYVNNDWLISPAQTLPYGGQLKFWALGATGYARFMVLASTTDNSMESFTQVGETFTKLGGSWNEFTYELPAGTKYFAVRNVTDCGGWIGIPFSVDDFSVCEYVISDGIESINIDAPRAQNAIYNLQGQRVGSTARGIIIVDGKKIVK